MPLDIPGYVAPNTFVAPGSAIANQLADILAQKRLEARQNMLDQLTMEHTRAQMDVARQNAEFLGEQRREHAAKFAEDARRERLDEGMKKQSLLFPGAEVSPDFVSDQKKLGSWNDADYDLPLTPDVVEAAGVEAVGQPHGYIFKGNKDYRAEKEAGNIVQGLIENGKIWTGQDKAQKAAQLTSALAGLPSSIVSKMLTSGILTDEAITKPDLPAWTVDAKGNWKPALDSAGNTIRVPGGHITQLPQPAQAPVGSFDPFYDASTNTLYSFDRRTGGLTRSRMPAGMPPPSGPLTKPGTPAREAGNKAHPDLAPSIRNMLVGAGQNLEKNPGNLEAQKAYDAVVSQAISSAQSKGLISPEAARQIGKLWSYKQIDPKTKQPVILRGHKFSELQSLFRVPDPNNPGQTMSANIDPKQLDEMENVWNTINRIP